MHAMSTEEPIVMDRYGDITLKVGNEDEDGNVVSFIACSRTLARISPVFDRMLYGHFAESKAGATQAAGDWTVKLPEDKPAPMEILLNIAHGHFRKVPKILAIDDLYELTALTHFYDATSLLAPWAQGWISLVDEIASDANMLMPKMLWISWELGCKDALMTTSRRLVMESEGPLLGDTCKDEEIHTPPDISERIDAIRTQTLCALLEIIRDMLSQLIVVDERPRWCRHAEWMGPHRCESMILGSMTFCLTRAGLWPLPDDPEELQYSVVGLYKKLTALIIHDIGQGDDGRSQAAAVDHQECNPRIYLLNQMQAVLDEIPHPLTEFHLQTVDEQARTLRLAGPA